MSGYYKLSEVPVFREFGIRGALVLQAVTYRGISVPPYGAGEVLKGRGSGIGIRVAENTENL